MLSVLWLEFKVDMNTTTSTFGHFSSLFNSPIRKLFVYIILFRLICAGILVWGSYQPPFDASHVVLWPELAANSQALLSRFISTALRWDVFHFQEIARRGYAYEHLYAFLPGTPAVMRIAASTSSLLGYGSGEHIISGTLWICWIIILLCGTSKTLYEFILLHTKSPEMAMLATACSLLPSSPSTLLHAPYAEPFFTFLSFKGKKRFFWCCAGSE
jgi:phosphatidylinositol glycan class V